MHFSAVASGNVSIPWKTKSQQEGVYSKRFSTPSSTQHSCFLIYPLLKPLSSLENGPQLCTCAWSPAWPLFVPTMNSSPSQVSGFHSGCLPLEFAEVSWRNQSNLKWLVLCIWPLIKSGSPAWVEASHGSPGPLTPGPLVFIRPNVNQISYLWLTSLFWEPCCTPMESSTPLPWE